jgi:hypothetical protein
MSLPDIFKHPIKLLIPEAMLFDIVPAFTRINEGTILHVLTAKPRMLSAAINNSAASHAAIAGDNLSRLEKANHCFDIIFRRLSRKHVVWVEVFRPEHDPFFRHYSFLFIAVINLTSFPALFKRLIWPAAATITTPIIVIASK